MIAWSAKCEGTYLPKDDPNPGNTLVNDQQNRSITRLPTSPIILQLQILRRFPKISAAFYPQPSIRSLLSAVFYPQPSIRSLLSAAFYPQPSIRSLLSAAFYPQPSIRSLLSAAFYPQPSIRSI
ncbi:hypothetical protein DPMN_148864 [Dreissena polymorpha]|nr:hypothetical protein DPMN_148864 [Dreissena polymorpha]